MTHRMREVADDLQRIADDIGRKSDALPIEQADDIAGHLLDIGESIQDILRADRQLRDELMKITDPKLRAECLRAL